MRKNEDLDKYLEYCKRIIKEFRKAYNTSKPQRNSICAQCLQQVKKQLYEFPEELKNEYQLAPAVHVNFKDNTNQVNPALKEYAIMVIFINPAQPAIHEKKEKDGRTSTVLLLHADKQRYRRSKKDEDEKTLEYRLKAHDYGVKHEYYYVKSYIKEYLNLKPDHVIVENLAKCPLKENLPRKQREEVLEEMIKHCFQHLKQQINLLQPDLIIAACKTYLDIELDGGETIEQALVKLGKDKDNVIILPHFRFALQRVENAYQQLLEQLKQHRHKLRKCIFEDQKLLETWKILTR